MKSDGLRGVPVFCSWSGGKDSALALHEAVRAGAEPRFLVSMMIESGDRSRSHGLRRELIAAQADALGLPVRFGAASWNDYEGELRRTIAAGVIDQRVGAGVFGDIDIERHREWVERVALEAGAQAVLPLWHRDRRQLMDDLLAAGFKAVVVAVRDGVLSPDLLGRTIDAGLVEEIVAAGADAAGENGEYHSVVVDGPGFRYGLDLEIGERSLRDGVWFVDLDLFGQTATSRA
ncbi:MAG TPA: diphthine--ammonia ligase [Solirubrobacterales bacterium]|nr:diphthine--ammonia ligase [Solirubrobacterales bacterium]